MRLGIYGGSFDPVHYGHLLLAECCRERHQLDAVWFLPAATPPHKQGQTLAPDRQRVEMLELAIGGHPGFRVSQLEIDRGGVSYTVDTLLTIHEQQPNAELFLLMGADSLHDLLTWHQPERICQLALPVVVARGGEPSPEVATLDGAIPEERIRQIEAAIVPMPQVELSSTEIRQRVAAQKSIRYRTPPAVEAYLAAQKVYQA